MAQGTGGKVFVECCGALSEQMFFCAIQNTETAAVVHKNKIMVFSPAAFLNEQIASVNMPMIVGGYCVIVCSTSQ